MKNRIITITILVSIGVSSLFGQSIWTEDDRSFLLEGLRRTKEAVLAKIDSLAEYQVFFKPDSTSWSIAEVVEHLAVYEEHLYWDLLYQQHSPERPELVEQVKGRDTAFLSYASDPSKGKAPWLAEPIGRFETKAELVKYFVDFRDRVISLIEGTSQDFRLHFIYREPSNTIWDIRDLHQYTLVWIAHTERHTNQIERIRNLDEFPKSGQLIWTDEEKNYLITELKRTRDEVIEEITSLNEGQLNFREDSARWSILEIVEHLEVQDELYFREIYLTTKTPQSMKYLSVVRGNDEGFLRYSTDQAKGIARWNLEPVGRIRNKEEAVFQFTRTRDYIIEFVDNTELDLRRFFTFRKYIDDDGLEDVGLWDVRDLHQLLLTTISHTDRHLSQIRRVKEHSDYPNE